METRQLDFFNHQYRCSAKCHSRNYMSAQKFDKPVVQKPPKLQKVTKPYQKSVIKQEQKLRMYSHKISQFLSNFSEELYQTARIQACVLKMMEHQKQEAVEKNTEMIKSWIVQSKCSIVNLTSDSSYELPEPAEFCLSAVNERQMNRISSAICQKIGQISQELIANKPNFNENATRLCQAMQVLGIDHLMAAELAKAHVEKLNNMKFPVQGEYNDILPTSNEKIEIFSKARASNALRCSED